MRGKPEHNKRPYARLLPSFLGMYKYKYLLTISSDTKHTITYFLYINQNGCMDDLITKRSFDSQATYVIDVFGINFVTS